MEFSPSHTYTRIQTHTRVDLTGLDLVQVDLVRVGHRYEPTNTLLLTLLLVTQLIDLQKRFYNLVMS